MSDERDQTKADEDRQRNVYQDERDDTIDRLDTLDSEEERPARQHKGGGDKAPNAEEPTDHESD